MLLLDVESRFTSRLYTLMLWSLLASFVVSSPLAFAGRLHAVDGEQTEYWYVVEMAGQQAGWMHILQTSDEQGQITTNTEMRMKIARGQVLVKIQVAGKFVETAKGEPVSMWSMQKYSEQATEMLYEFGDTEITLTTTSGERINISTIPLPDSDWLTPVDAGKYVEARLKAGVKRIEFKTIDPMVGVQPIGITQEILERNVEIKVGGVSYKAVKWRVSQDYMPGTDSTEWVDAHGVTLLSETKFGGFEMTMWLSDRATALQKTNAPEMMVSTFVKPNKPIHNPRETTRVVMDLSIGDDGEIPELPTTAAQTVEVLDGGTLRLTVTTKSNHPATAEEIADASYIDANVYIDAADSQIVTLANRAAKRAKSNSHADQASEMRAFVHGYINEKALGVGFATASEVAENRTGDCTEHAVLLTALLRAKKIPSRVVTGLIYADQFAGERGIFGYHMWSQALIDGQWVDYDATLRQQFDATHITTSTSALSEGSFSRDMSSMLPLLGRLQVVIVEVEY